MNVESRQHQTGVDERSKRRARRWVVAILAAAAVLVVAVFGGGLAWLYFSRESAEPLEDALDTVPVPVTWDLVGMQTLEANLFRTNCAATECPRVTREYVTTDIEPSTALATFGEIVEAGGFAVLEQSESCALPAGVNRRPLCAMTARNEVAYLDLVLSDPRRGGDAPADAGPGYEITISATSAAGDPPGLFPE